MKKTIVLLALLFYGIVGFAQNPTAILGYWYLPENNQGEIVVAEIKEKDGNYFSYGFAIKGKSEVSDTAQNVRGVMIFWDLQFNKNSWEGGKIYNPDHKKTYAIKATITDDGNTLLLKVQVPFGPTLKWQRACADVYQGLPLSEIKNPW